MADRANDRAWVAAAVAGLALMAMGAPRRAEACGATFCDSGPAAMPVTQTGETILFVIDDGYVEAHIQIQYDPDSNAEQFAWVVPVTALPEFTVGSQRLFANLLTSTVPAYGTSSWNESCGFGSGGFDDGCDGTGGFDEGGAAKLDLAVADPDPPQIVLTTTVGAFEVFVLDGGSVEGVMEWLGDNGFAQDPAAAPILDEYLAEGHLFVAFRLIADAGVGEIHPITLRYPGAEPCVPIRLTRIAAQEDMDIRAFFLADDRVASSNYRHVTLNPLRIDWLGQGANYREVVTMAVDEPGADGHAFVTEYAGPSEIVTRTDILGAQWDSLPFTTASVEDAVMLLRAQELYRPDDFGMCTAVNPLIDGLVARYLPTPPELTLDTICSNPRAFVGAVDPLAWDGPAFAADLQERIIEPGLHASALLDTWPVLTRLYTTLSPNEMTEDPMFHPTPALPEQTTLTWLGTRNRFCDAAISFGLPDGRLVAMLDFLEWPAIAPETMPWAETIAYLPAAGAPVVEVDERELITMLLDTWNAEQGPPRSPTSAACGNDGTSSNTGLGSEGSAGGVDVNGGGCGCQESRPSNGGGPALMLLGLLGLRRRREA